jgi:hypothetical protein
MAKAVPRRARDTWPRESFGPLSWPGHAVSRRSRDLVERCTPALLEHILPCCLDGNLSRALVAPSATSQRVGADGRCSSCGSCSRGHAKLRPIRGRMDPWAPERRFPSSTPSTNCSVGGSADFAPPCLRCLRRVRRPPGQREQSSQTDGLQQTAPLAPATAGDQPHHVTLNLCMRSPVRIDLERHHLSGGATRRGARAA